MLEKIKSLFAKKKEEEEITTEGIVIEENEEETNDIGGEDVEMQDEHVAEEIEEQETIDESGEQKKKIPKPVFIVAGVFLCLLLIYFLLPKGGKKPNANGRKQNVAYSTVKVKRNVKKRQYNPNLAREVLARKRLLMKKEKENLQMKPVEGKPVRKMQKTAVNYGATKQAKQQVKQEKTVATTTAVTKEVMKKNTTTDTTRRITETATVTANDTVMVKPANVFKSVFLIELDNLINKKQVELNQLSQQISEIEKAIQTEKERMKQISIKRQNGNVKKVVVNLPDVKVQGISCVENRCIAYTNLGVLYPGKVLSSGEKVIKITENQIVTDQRVINFYE